MLDLLSAPQSAALNNLRRLFWLRMLMAAVILLTSWAAFAFYGMRFPIPPLAAAVGLMLMLNAATWWRLTRSGPLGDREILIQLLLDMAILTGLFYGTGGYSNPFMWMYLLPLSVAAVALPWRQVWLIAGLAVACYSGLMFWYQPLPMMEMDMSGMSPAEMRRMHMHHESGFSIHLLGMWAGFVVSAGVVAFFVERIGRTLREYDGLMAQAREKALESERMLALGTLATAAAHELGTPLATMAVLAGELAEDCADRPEATRSLALMRSQIERCKHILTSITSSAGRQRAEDGHSQALDEFLNQTITRWHNLRPSVDLDCRLHGMSPAPVIAVDRTLGQALVNLLDNAADVSPGHVEVRCIWDTEALVIAIRDAGPGLPPNVAEQAGRPFFTTKEEKGMGLGLYLARMIFERFGGTITLGNHPQGGALTEVRLPLATLVVKENP